MKDLNSFIYRMVQVKKNSMILTATKKKYDIQIKILIRNNPIHISCGPSKRKKKSIIFITPKIKSIMYKLNFWYAANKKYNIQNKFSDHNNPSTYHVVQVKKIPLYWLTDATMLWFMTFWKICDARNNSIVRNSLPADNRAMLKYTPNFNGFGIFFGLSKRKVLRLLLFFNTTCILDNHTKSMVKKKKKEVVYYYLENKIIF